MPPIAAAVVGIGSAIGAGAAAVGGAIASGVGALGAAAAGTGAIGTIGTALSVASTGLSIAGAVQQRNEARRAATTAAAQNAASKEQRFLELRKERIRLAAEERTNQANLFSAALSGGVGRGSITQAALISERSNLQSQQQFVNTQSVLLDRATQSAQNPLETVAGQLGSGLAVQQQTTPTP